MAEQEVAYQRVINAIGAITLSVEEGKRIIAFVEGAIHGGLNPAQFRTGINGDKRPNGFDDCLKEGETSIPNRSSLSRCPFCGGGGVSVHTEPFNISTYVVVCSNCGAKGSIAETAIESVARWNIGTTNIKKQ